MRWRWLTEGADGEGRFQDDVGMSRGDDVAQGVVKRCVQSSADGMRFSGDCSVASRYGDRCVARGKMWYRWNLGRLLRQLGLEAGSTACKVRCLQYILSAVGCFSDRRLWVTGAAGGQLSRFGCLNIRLPARGADWTSRRLTLPFGLDGECGGHMPCVRCRGDSC